MVTHPSTNRAWCRVMSLIKSSAHYSYAKQPTAELRYRELNDWHGVDGVLVAVIGVSAKLNRPLLTARRYISTTSNTHYINNYYYSDHVRRRRRRRSMTTYFEVGWRTSKYDEVQRQRSTTWSVKVRQRTPLQRRRTTTRWWHDNDDTMTMISDDDSYNKNKQRRRQSQ